MQVSIKGYRDGSPVVFTKNITLAEHLTSNFMLPQILAKQKIDRLAINQGATDNNNDSIIQISIGYQVLSSYTAFLAMQPPEDHSGATDIIYQTKPVLRNTIVRNIFCTGKTLSVILSDNEYISDILIFDLSGKAVFHYNAGSSRNLRKFLWNGLMNDGSRLSNGHYIIKLRLNSSKCITQSIIWNNR